MDRTVMEQKTFGIYLIYQRAKGGAGQLPLLDPFRAGLGFPHP